MSRAAKTALICAVVLFGPSTTIAEPADVDANSRLIVFHAGSLATPLQQICAEFNKIHPNIRILREAAGSRICARKVTALNKPCDVLACADYTVIETLLINAKPRTHADWLIKFASNEMVIAFRDESAIARSIDRNNWMDLMLQKDAAFGRSDPNSDPCGYRSVLVMRLAEKFYSRPGLAARMLAKDRKYIRPKETDLLALLEVGEIDCIFIYRSIAEQHKLKYIALPDSINLKSEKHADFYRTASVRLTGAKPGAFITKTAEPIIYGVTIPKNSPNPQAAELFLQFLLSRDKGAAILAKNGQASVIPSPTKTYDNIPRSLKAFARPYKKKAGK